MTGSKRKRLESTVAALQLKYGPQSLRPGRELPAVRTVPHIPTGFVGLDALTGCGGMPTGYMTLLSGRSTSGKYTLALKTLANAQQNYPRRSAVLVDLNRTCDPDYLRRAGVDLDRLQIVQANADRQMVDVLGDLVRSRKISMMVVNGLPNLQVDISVHRYLIASLGRMEQSLRESSCALIWIDETSPPWLRLFRLDSSGPARAHTALHIELQWEQWLGTEGSDLHGYRAQAKLLKSRWARTGRAVPVEIVFNGTVRARETW